MLLTKNCTVPIAACLIWVFVSTETAKGSGPLQRIPNTTLRMPPTPPTHGFSLVNAFGDLSFNFPLAILSPPGETNRLFVVEQGGTVAVITNLSVPNRTVFLDISTKVLGGVPTDERGLLGMAFHPDYATNGYFYVFYTGNATTSVATNVLHEIIARYQVSAANLNQALPNSEVRLLLQSDEADNHNGGDLHFGPDGYLYFSIGDEGGGYDQFTNSQLIDKDFFSAISRIDVDMRPGSLPPNSHAASTTNYAVPPDNPFVGVTNFNGSSVNPASVRTEFWAVGLRNPFRFSFDPQTGFLYCGDVGQDAWEEVDIITRGGNYGWAYLEATHPGPKNAQAPAGFASTSKLPIQEYAHGSASNQGNCVIGGVVYRGTRLAQLFGAYVFGDYVDGNIWTLTYDGTNSTPFNRIVAGEPGISAYGLDPSNGDVLMASQSLKTIRRLVYTAGTVGTPIPPTLAETGAFTNLSALTPNPGIAAYDINVPFWSDNALKSRWFSLPDMSQAITFDPSGNWGLPSGSVWIKHFDLPLTNGVPSSARRLETRLLVRNTNGVYGVTYRWVGSLTNATLVAEEGMDESFVIDDGGGVLRTQVWHYPSRSECLMCHTAAGGYALGFNTPQMNRDVDYSGTVTNQIAALCQAGYFNTNLIATHVLRALSSATNGAVSLEYRVRSYLAANCVQCHQPGGVPAAQWDARITTPSPQAGIIDVALVNDAGDSNNRVVKPGSLTNSMMFNRVSAPGAYHMPPLATSVINTQAVALLAAWITNGLPNYQSFAAWQLAHLGSTNSPNAAPYADPDGDLGVNYLEYLTGTDPLQRTNFWKIGILRKNTNTFEINYPQIANRGFEVQKLKPTTGGTWSPLDVPGNEPFFSVSNRPAAVDDLGTNAGMVYRVRVYEP